MMVDGDERRAGLLQQKNDEGLALFDFSIQKASYTFIIIILISASFD